MDLIAFKAKTDLVNLTVWGEGGLKNSGCKKLNASTWHVRILKETLGVIYKKINSLACLDENEKYIFYIKKNILYPIGPDR